MKLILILLLLSTAITAQKKEHPKDAPKKKIEDKISFNNFQLDMLSIGAGSNYDGEFSVLSFSYRTSFPGVGFKVNTFEQNIVEKSIAYNSFFVPYLLIPLRAHKNAIDKSMLDGEVEFFAGGTRVFNITGYNLNQKVFYLNGGISISKMFDTFKSTSLSLKIGYKSLFNGKVSSDTKFHNNFYGVVVLNNHIFKTHSNYKQSIKKQNRNLALKAIVGTQFNRSYFTINGTKLEPTTSLFYQFSFSRPINKYFNLIGSYSNIGSFNIEESDTTFQSKGNTFTFGPEYNILSLQNGFSLPVSAGLGASIINNIEYKDTYTTLSKSTLVSLAGMINIQPTYSIKLTNSTISILGSAELNGTPTFRTREESENLYYKAFGYNFALGAKFEF